MLNEKSENYNSDNSKTQLYSSVSNEIAADTGRDLELQDLINIEFAQRRAAESAPELDQWVLDEWRASAVDDEIISLNVRQHRGKQEIAALLGWKYANKDRDNGWSVPVYHVVPSVCMKLQNPLWDKQKNKPIKYLHTCGSKGGVMIPLLPKNRMRAFFERYDVCLSDEDIAGGYVYCLHKHKIPLHVCEGAKKAAALLSAGYAAIAIRGCWMGMRKQETSAAPIYELIPELKIFAQKEVKITLVPDNDSKPKTIFQVTDAFSRLARAFEKLKCDVTFKLIEEHKGVDDFIANRGSGVFALLPERDLDYYRARLQRLQPYKPHQYINYESLVGTDCQTAFKLPEDKNLIFLDSCKGSGKTWFMLAHPRRAKRVIIVPRRLLARNIYDRAVSETFKNASKAYEELGKVGFYQEITSGVDTLIICADSLPKIYPSEWAGAEVWLDEVELLLQHIYLSPTCRDNRISVDAFFQYLLRQSSLIVAMSADLSHKSIDYLEAATKRSAHIIKNLVKSAGYDCKVRRTEDPNHGSVIAELIDDLAAGKKIFVYSDSRRMVKVITREICKRFPDAITQEIHGENSNDPDVVKFVASLTGAGSLEVNLLAASPSLGTGVSIEKEYFDVVYGIFQGKSQPVTDMVQGLIRVRSLVPRIISILDSFSSDCADFETEKERLYSLYMGTTKSLTTTAIVNQCRETLQSIEAAQSLEEAKERASEIDRILSSRDQQFEALNFTLKSLVRTKITPELGLGLENEELLDLLAWINVHHNYSLNSPANNLIGLLKIDGHRVTVEEEGQEHKDAAIVSESVEATKQVVKYAEIDLVDAQPLISKEQKRELDARKDSLTSIEKAKLKKYVINESLGRCDRRTIELNDEHDLIRGVSLLHIATCDQLEATAGNLRDSISNIFVNDRRNVYRLWELFQALDVARLLDPEHKFSHADELTRELAGKIWDNRKQLIRHFPKMKIHKKECDTYPIRVLGKILNLLGLEFVKVKAGKTNNYLIHQELWVTTQAALKHRTDKNARQSQEEIEKLTTWRDRSLESPSDSDGIEIDEDTTSDTPQWVSEIKPCLMAVAHPTPEEIRTQVLACVPEVQPTYEEIRAQIIEIVPELSDLITKKEDATALLLKNRELWICTPYSQRITDKLKYHKDRLSRVFQKITISDCLDQLSPVVFTLQKPYILTA